MPFAILLLPFSILVLLFLIQPTAAAPAELWVAPTGSDANSGSSNAPLATLHAALIKWQYWSLQLSRPAMHATNASPSPDAGTVSPSPRLAGVAGPNGERVGVRCFHIILRDGIYPLSAPLLFHPSDSDRTNLPLLIEAAPGEHPVLSGATPIGHWKKLTRKIPGLPAASRGHVWVADAPKLHGHVLEFRQLWIGDQKAIRAREPNDGNLARLVAWDKTNQIATIPAATLADIKKPNGLEMVIDQVWEIAVLRIASIHRTENASPLQGAGTVSPPPRLAGACPSPAGAGEGGRRPDEGRWGKTDPCGPNGERAGVRCALLTFLQPESRLEFQHPWPPVTVNDKYQAPFYLANAIEFLDQPGEWFEDVPAGKIYYWPRRGEDLARAKVFAPALETLAQIEGKPDKPVTQIQFKGIAFAHTTWLRPSQMGHVPLQAGMYLLDTKKLSPKGTPYHPKLDNLAWIGRPPAAVSVKNAAQISFINCAFEHLAAAGLDFADGTHDDLVQGCAFHDLGGNGLQLGKFSDPEVETHVPYNPPDEREICAHEKISNNLFSDCGNEDWGCVGIAVGYARNISLEHNELFNLPYTGISLGWGWTKMTNALRDNFVSANRIHDIGRRLGDLGGIYTLSAQPGTVIAENAISDITPSPFVPDPQHWYYLYLDEGSSFITVRDNWCPAEKFLKNANGPGNLWTNNGPQVSETIKNAAGLEPAYKNRLTTP